MKDLSTIGLQETADVELTHPRTGDGLRSYLVLAGPEHPVRKRLELDKDRQLRRQINKKGAIELDDPEEDRKKQLEYLSQCTLGWYSMEPDGEGGERRVETIMLGGEPKPYSIAAARELYSTPALGWIKQQARDGLAKQEVFISDSSRG